MIINNISTAQVTSDKLVEFSERDIKYVISADSNKIEGTVAANSYRDVSVSNLGSGPYTVTLGYVNDSWRAAPVEVESADALLTFWMAFPAGPNGPETFIYSKG